MEAKVTNQKVLWVVHRDWNGSTAVERTAVPIDKILGVNSYRPSYDNQVSPVGGDVQFAMITVEGLHQPLRTLHQLSHVLDILGEEIFLPVSAKIDTDYCYWRNGWNE